MGLSKCQLIREQTGKFSIFKGQENRVERLPAVIVELARPPSSVEIPRLSINPP